MTFRLVRFLLVLLEDLVCSCWFLELGFRVGFGIVGFGIVGFGFGGRW